jgi:hypothetical protein
MSVDHEWPNRRGEPLVLVGVNQVRRGPNLFVWLRGSDAVYQTYRVPKQLVADCLMALRRLTAGLRGWYRLKE